MEKMQLTRQQIINLAKNQDNPDLRYEKAFLMHLFGSANNIFVFEILIGWLPYSKRPDGSIYKSDVELAKETGLSKGTIERSRKILKEAGFDIYVKKANGSPTNHYRFDLEKFIQFVAGKLNAEVEKVREWLSNLTRSKARMKNQQFDETDARKPVKMTSTVRDAETPQTDEIATTKLPKSVTSPTTTSTNILENNAEPTAASEVTSLDNSGDGSGSDPVLKLEINRLHSILKIPHAEIEAWINEYGFHRINNLTKYAIESGEVKYPAKWMSWALKTQYALKSGWIAVKSPFDYTTGRYAAFIRS